MGSPALPGSTPSVGESSAEFAKQKRAKSPPLAFEKTSNDSLAPFIPTQSDPADANTSAEMGRLSPPYAGNEHDWQVVVDQQAAAIQLLHDAFSAERQAWTLEKDRLYQRIAKLEKLLRAGDGYSPARSPALSPLNLSNLTSPQPKTTTNSHRLPSIAEDEAGSSPPLAQRREKAPQSIDIPDNHFANNHTDGSVSFAEVTPSSIIIEEIPNSPGNTATLSPPPLINRMAAGHTPIKAPRPLTPPPLNGMSFDGIEDTPTRNNTHLNAFLVTSHDEDKERELTGPLHMPELPNKPDDANFTFEALSKRLEQIERNPDESKPMIFSEPSPGLASPATELADGEERPLAPIPTRVPESTTSELSSNALSSAALSPISRHASREQEDDKVQAAFENGGIRLKKKLSTNFGAPFGSLGGFGGGRKASQDRQ